MIEDPTAIRAALEAGQVGSVLALRAARVGDTLHVRPALELLRRALPAARLTFLCSDYAVAAARDLPLDALVPYPHKGRTPRALLGRRAAEATLAARGPYDLLLGLEDKPWGRELAARLGVTYRHARSEGGAHVVERKAGVLTPLGLYDPARDGPPPEIAWRPFPAARATAAASLEGLPRPRIGLQVGSHAGRTLLAPRRRRDPDPAWLAALGQALHDDLGAGLVLNAGTGGAEARAARQVTAALQSADVPVRLLRGLDLDGLGAVQAELDAWVSANTGPAHLAAAQQVPLVLLEGPSTPAARPWRAEATTRVLNLGLDCAPCGGTSHGRACRVPRCLDEIPPAQVLDALAELGLGARP